MTETQNKSVDQANAIPQKISFEQLMLMAPAFVPPAMMSVLEKMKPVLEKKFNELAAYPARIIELEKI